MYKRIILKLSGETLAPEKTPEDKNASVTFDAARVNAEDMTDEERARTWWHRKKCGGGAYLDGAVRNIQSLGISAENTITMAATTPAVRMGLSDLGTIEPGKRAHLTAWNEDWKVAFAITNY